MMTTDETLYLVDGSSYIFRAFFALPHLSNSRGMPTNAVYGFARMLLKLLKEAKPRLLAVVFDSPKRTFRHDIAESYKANRPEASPQLVVQIPYIQRLVEALGIKKLAIDGFEADDVIGTLARRAVAEHLACVIVAGDKDFMQLVGPGVTLWDTMKDRRIGPAEVRERFGVEPGAVVDVLALSGDPTDNVKGVPGVGEKTASLLIGRFGSLEGLLSQLDTLPGLEIRGARRLAQALDAGRAQIELARKLVKIETQVPLTATIEELRRRQLARDALTDLLRELEFDSLLEELAPLEPPEPTAPPTAARSHAEAAAIAAQVCDDLATLVGQLAKAPRLALNLRAGTASLELQAESGERAFLVELGDGERLSPLDRLLASDAPAKVCHDLKRHLRELARYRLSLGGVEFDTMLAGFLIDSTLAEPSIEKLAARFLDAAALRCRAPEVRTVLALRGVLAEQLKQDGLAALFGEIEMPVARVLAGMEACGVRVEAETLRSLSAEFAHQMSVLEGECFELAGVRFNLNSPVQVQEVLFERLKLPVAKLKRRKSGYSTDVDTLEKLAAAHPLPGKLLQYRALAKLKSTYADSLVRLIEPGTGRVHTSFHQAVTATGRLSSSEPNLQNIPIRTEEGRRIRRAFVAREGHRLLSADYSQIELRVLAHLSQDATLIEAFVRGEDIHVRAATEILGIRAEQVDSAARRLAKVVNFGILYGMGPQRLARELAIGLPQARAYIERYFERMPGVRAYIERTLEQGRRQGFVATMFGRRRYLPELRGPAGVLKAQAERIAVNTPVQGSAAELIKLAMVRLAAGLERRRSRAKLVLQVHDELLLEVAEDEIESIAALVRHEMENAAPLQVPLRVELKWGPNWADLRAAGAVRAE
jgi:DNA polymerase-1